MPENASSRNSAHSRRSVLTAAAMASLGGTALVAHAGAQDASPVPVQEASPVPMQDGEATFLFVQSGFTSGILDQATEGVQSWLLTLQGAPAQTVFFSDRPARIAGAMSTQKFLETLDFSSDDPPNAALVIGTEEGADVVILELTQPAYDADAGTLTYIAKILDVDLLESTGYGFPTDPLGPDNYPAEFGPASLFIDSAMGCSPWDPRC